MQLPTSPDPPPPTHTHAHACAGAATSDIIQQYVSTIKALAHVDPGGTILGAVGDPIRAYLRERKDTIRCIVTMLTADEEDAAAQSLAAELGNTDQAAEVGARPGEGSRLGHGSGWRLGRDGGRWGCADGLAGSCAAHKLGASQLATALRPPVLGVPAMVCEAGCAPRRCLLSRRCCAVAAAGVRQRL